MADRVKVFQALVFPDHNIGRRSHRSRNKSRVSSFLIYWRIQKMSRRKRSCCTLAMDKHRLASMKFLKRVVMHQIIQHGHFKLCPENLLKGFANAECDHMPVSNGKVQCGIHQIQIGLSFMARYRSINEIRVRIAYAPLVHRFLDSFVMLSTNHASPCA
ncbi:hypothetical protein D3C78_1203770 [compost metagenome]